MKRIISLMLVMIMLLSFGSGVFADVVGNRSSETKYEIKMLDGTVLTQEEFIEYLYNNQDKIIEINGGKDNKLKIDQHNGRPDAVTTATYAAPISDGTYYIKGIGEVVIEFGKFFVAGIIVKSGTWLYDKIVDFFESLKASPSISVSGMTITVNGTKYRCDERAEEAVYNMQRRNHYYYPAILYGGEVWVAPVEIDRNTALEILKFNSRVAGVFAITNSRARGLCDSLGGAIFDNSHGSGSGYWDHYHARNYRNAHCWFIY